MTEDIKEFVEEAHSEAEKDVVFMQVYHFIDTTKFDDSIMEVKRFSEQVEDKCSIYFT